MLNLHVGCLKANGVAKAFPGGRLAQTEGQNVDKNDKSLRKNKKKLMEIWGKIRKVELLSTWDCDAGYASAGSGSSLFTEDHTGSNKMKT